MRFERASVRDMVEKRKEFPDWEQYYKDSEAESMPWFHPEIDHDLERTLKNLNLKTGKCLDLCTGPGTQALALAEKGYKVTANEISDTAIDNARSKAAEKGLNIDFRQDDILDMKLDDEFDFVFDRGCFHVLQPEQRRDYVHIVRGLIKPGGYLFLKTFSQAETREGPYRFTPEQIRNLFSFSFNVLSIENSFFQGTIDPPPKALFSILQRTE